MAVVHWRMQAEMTRAAELTSTSTPVAQLLMRVSVTTRVVVDLLLLLLLELVKESIIQF